VPSFASRPLTAAERYYAYLDCVAPMNLLLMAELDRVFPADEVAARWSEFARVRALPRLRVRADLTLADGPARDVGFRAAEVGTTGWDAELAAESGAPFGFDRPMRLCYLASPGEGRSRLVFVVHHAIVDGRVGIADLQRFVRSLDGQPVAPQDGLTLAVPATRSFPWQRDRQQFLALLRELAARNAAAGEPEPRGWPAGVEARRPRFFSLTVDAGDARGVLAAAKAQGTRAYPLMAATWLAAVAEHLGADDPAVLQLATPADLAEPSPEPDRPTAPVVTVLAGRYAVSPTAAPWDLARQITANLDAALARGEGELFFTLARAEALIDLEAGSRAVARALASAPPAVSVTNLGPVDPGSDPAWLRGMCGYLAAAPNQVLFVSGLGYRGRLVHSIATDDTQLPAEHAAAVIAGYTDRLRSLARAAA
jgi:hypothetical protein